MKSKATKPEAHETHDPSPHEVVAYECNTEAGLSDDDGRVESVGENNHDAAEVQYERTHSETNLEGKGENPSRLIKEQSRATEGRHVSSRPRLDVTAERRRTNQASHKAAEAAHEKGTKRVRGREWAKTIKAV